MKKPDFFIVGAPKCGTTALAEYLRQHPDVFFSDPKEPCYFCNDFPRKRYVESESDYTALFRKAKSGSILGEGSVWYLYSECAIENIYQFNPNAKIIAMIRNPVDLVYSLHSQLVYSGEETISDFEEAWDIQYKRLKWI